MISAGGTGAVILAAGAGLRLGGVAKALLRSPSGATYLEQIVATARAARLVAGVVVVGPPHGDEIAMHAKALGLRVVVNQKPERGMASSVALGFAAIAETECAAAWLWPVDHPDVTVATLHALHAGRGIHDAARPVVGGRGGHPPLVARALWPQLAGCATTDGGARAVLAAADTVDIAVTDAGCVRDVDTPEDLR